MKLFFDENIPKAVIRHFREKGFEVLSVKELHCGADDPLILEHARQNDFVILTQDKDFGELIFKQNLPSSNGIILFRLAGTSRDEDIKRMVDSVSSRSDWPGHFAVITDDRIRVRPLPSKID